MKPILVPYIGSHSIWNSLKKNNGWTNLLSVDLYASHVEVMIQPFEKGMDDEYMINFVHMIKLNDFNICECDSIYENFKLALQNCLINILDKSSLRIESINSGTKPNYQLSLDLVMTTPYGSHTWKDINNHKFILNIETNKLEVEEQFDTLYMIKRYDSKDPMFNQHIIDHIPYTK